MLLLSLINLPTGCRFAARCPFRFEKCDKEPPMFGKRAVQYSLYGGPDMPTFGRIVVGAVAQARKSTV